MSKPENKDVLIESLRKDFRELLSHTNAIEQENALLENEVERLNRKLGKPQKPFDVIRNTREKS